MPHSAFQTKTVWTNDAVISDAICRAPEITHTALGGHVHCSRWRHFVGSYTVPALPAPLFVVHLAGKPDVRFWDRDGWSESTTFPGAATIVPAGRETRWLVDGELDVITFSLAPRDEKRTASRFNAMHFAYSDPLGVALAEQILCELYRGSGIDSAYVESLVSTLTMHVANERSNSDRIRYPTSGSSSFRIHKVMNVINKDPAGHHSLDELSDLAGVNKSHLCRVFKQSVGVTLHNYLLNARLDRARQLLARPDLSVAQVAELSGFLGASQFARAFRHHVNETPSSYRQRTLGQAA